MRRLIVVLGVVLLVGCGGGEDVDETTAASVAEVVDAARSTTVPTTTVAEVGTQENPAALGDYFDTADGEWTVSVLEFRDPVDGNFDTDVFALDPVPDGFVRKILTYEATYNGENLTESVFAYPELVGSQVWDQSTEIPGGSAGSCSYALDFEVISEVTAGQTFRNYTCWTIPADELDGLLILFEVGFGDDWVFDPARW